MKNENQNEEQSKSNEKEQQRKRDERVNSIDNLIAQTIKVMALVILGIGVIKCFIIKANSLGEEGTMVTILISYGIVALFSYSLGEIIQILHDIRAKVYKK